VFTVSCSNKTATGYISNYNNVQEFKVINYNSVQLFLCEHSAVGITRGNITNTCMVLKLASKGS